MTADNIDRPEYFEIQSLLDYVEIPRQFQPHFGTGDPGITREGDFHTPLHAIEEFIDESYRGIGLPVFGFCLLLSLDSIPARSFDQ